VPQCAFRRPLTFTDSAVDSFPLWHIAGPCVPTPRHPPDGNRLAGPRGAFRYCFRVAGNSALTVIHHVLSNPDATFCDLGGYYESRINNNAAWPRRSGTSRFAAAVLGLRLGRRVGEARELPRGLSGKLDGAVYLVAWFEEFGQRAGTIVVVVVENFLLFPYRSYTSGI
jgi:hypothetical protein